MFSSKHPRRLKLFKPRIGRCLLYSLVNDVLLRSCAEREVSSAVGQHLFADSLLSSLREKHVLMYVSPYQFPASEILMSTEHARFSALDTRHQSEGILEVGRKRLITVTWIPERVLGRCQQERMEDQLDSECFTECLARCQTKSVRRRASSLSDRTANNKQSNERVSSTIDLFKSSVRLRQNPSREIDHVL